MNVCRGEIQDAEDNVEIELKCPNQNWTFESSDLDGAKRETRRVLTKNGYDAELRDTRS